MFTPKTAVLLAVLATAAPVLSYNPYTVESSLYARDFDDLYIRDIEDLDIRDVSDLEFEMQKRDLVENYLAARDDLESLLYARAGNVVKAEQAALQDHRQTQRAKGQEHSLQNKIKGEERALKKTEQHAKAEKGTIRKDERKGSAAQRQVKADLGGKGKGKRSLFDDFSLEW